MKLLGILEREGLGKIDKTSGQDITLYKWVNDQVRELERVEEEESKSEMPPSVEVSQDGSLSGVKQKFVELKSNPAHSVFPISVMLELKANEHLQLVSRLQADAGRNTVWPNAIQHYQPFKMLGDDPFEHYAEKVTSSNDPYFDVGLFGQCNNGLTMLLLALAKGSDAVKKSRKSSGAATAAASSSADESSGNEKLRKVLYHFITLVALQYWTLVHRRWMELNPATSKNSTRYLPEFMFIFHHSTDFTQSFKDSKRERKGDKKKKKTENTEIPAQQQLPLMRTNADLRMCSECNAFIPFLDAVFEYVIERMSQLEDSETEEDTDIANACKKLGLSRKAVKKHCENVSTNHTQFFVCSRFKMHIVHGLVDIINDGVHCGTPGQSLGFQETKFFARNKDQLKMNIPKAANEAATAGNNRYNSPYFWSHLTFLPMQGVVMRESTMDGGNFAEVESSYQACALRRLLFAVDGGDAKTILGVLAFIGDCTFRFAGSQEKVTLTSKEFIEQFVYTKKFASMAALHADRVNQQVCLPAVAKPAALRYCLQFDDEIGRAYVPSLSRDLASFPVSDEHDILSMSPSHFIACSMGKNIVENQAVLLAMGVLSKNPADLCKRFASSRLTLSTFPVLKHLGGLSSSFTKLCPDDLTCDLVYIDSSLRLTVRERKQLQLIAKAEGRFVAIDMWTLLQKITASDVDAVSSFLFHARRHDEPVVKMEEDGNGPLVSTAAAAAVAEYPRAWILDRLASLKADWERAQQTAVARFRRSWGALIPSPNRDPKKRKSDEQESQDDWVENPYWPAQEKFIAGLRQGWNFCDRPVVSTSALGRLLRGLMDADLGQFQITLYKRDTTEGGIKLDAEKLKQFLADAVIFQLGQKGPAPVHQLTDIAIADGRDCADIADHEIVFHGNERSPLGKKFAEFLPLGAGQTARRYATTSCNIEVAFFMWYYFTEVVRPFIDNLPRLFPISSVIKQKLKSSVLPQSWVQSLVPSDGTPHLTSLLFKLSAEICKAEIRRELDTSLTRGTKISGKAQAMLQAMQIVIEIQDRTDPTRNEDSKLEEVNRLAAQLLNGAHAPLAVAVQPRVAQGTIPVTRLKALEDQAFKVIIQQLKVFKQVPPAVVIKIFDDLCALMDIDQDVPEIIARLFQRVQGTLAASSSLRQAYDNLKKTITLWKTSDGLLAQIAAKFTQLARSV